MNVEPSILGSTLLILGGLLSTYLLVIRIREHLAEKPDPKLTYATNKQLDNLTQQLNRLHYETKNDIQNLRLESKDDYMLHDQRLNDLNQSLYMHTGDNAKEIAATSKQVKACSQALSELNIKTDKILLANHYAKK